MAGLALDHVQIAMPAGGEAAARAFFGDLLGLPEIAKPADLAARGGCWFALGTLQLHLGVDPAFRAASKAHVALRSPVLADLRSLLVDAGCVLVDEAPVDGHARFFTADPFGNRIEFVAA